MPKYPLSKVIIVLAFCFATQLFSMSIQQKFNEFLNSLLGGYTLSLSHMLSGGKKPVVVAVPPYITFDLNVTETTGELAFIINEKNMQYIVSKNDIEKINKLKAFCTQENEKIRTLKEKLVAMRWIQFIRPYIKTDLENKIKKLQDDILKKLRLRIDTINKDEATIIKLAINQKNDQYSISWDPDINNLLYSKISAITAIYTLFEGLKPLVKEDKKLNAIHQKWQMIEKITNIKLNIQKLNEELKGLSLDFAKKMQENLDKTGRYLETGRTYVLNTVAALLPYVVLGTVGGNAYDALIRIIKANMPDWIKGYIADVFKTRVTLFQSSEKLSPFLTFVENNDEIEKELIDIFSFEITQNAKTIIPLDAQELIAVFNKKLEEYLEKCLLGYVGDNPRDINTFNRNKKSFANPLHEAFKSLKENLSNYPDILLEQKDSTLIIKITSIYETQMQITDILNTLDQKTKNIFDKEINEILADAQKTPEQKLSFLNRERMLIEKIAKDIKEKNELIHELHNLISSLSIDNRAEYTNKIQEIKEKNFITNDERNKVMLELLDLKAKTQKILLKKPKSKTEQLKAGVTGFLFGWITDEEKGNLKSFIYDQYKIIEEQYGTLSANQQNQNKTLQKTIPATKKRFLQEAEEVVVRHKLEELKERVEEKIQQFEDKIKTLSTKK